MQIESTADNLITSVEHVARQQVKVKGKTMKIGTLMNAELTREIRQVFDGNGKKVWLAAIIKTSTEGKRTIIWIREFKSKAAAERFEG